MAVLYRKGQSVVVSLCLRLSDKPPIDSQCFMQLFMALVDFFDSDTCLETIKRGSFVF